MGQKKKRSDRRRDHESDERRMAWAKGLRARYDKVAQEPVPEKFRKLLRQIDETEPSAGNHVSGHGERAGGRT